MLTQPEEQEEASGVIWHRVTDEKSQVYLLSTAAVIYHLAVNSDSKTFDMRQQRKMLPRHLLTLRPKEVELRFLVGICKCRPIVSHHSSHVWFIRFVFRSVHF